MAEIDIIPGVLEKEWDAVVSRVEQVVPYVKSIHIYISDGTLGTNETFAKPEQFADLIGRYPDIVFEAHILSATPEKFIRPLADSGFRRVIAHVEANDPRRFLAESKYDEVEVGLALDGASEVEQIEPFLEEIDFVLVMTAEAGVSGATFLPEAVEKIKAIHQNFQDLPIEVAGGITDRSIKAVYDVGANRMVASSFIYANPAGEELAIQTLSESIG